MRNAGGKRNTQISRNLRILEKCARGAQISRNFFRKRGAPKFRKKNCEILGWGNSRATQWGTPKATLGPKMCCYDLYGPGIGLSCPYMYYQAV